MTDVNDVNIYTIVNRKQIVLSDFKKEGERANLGEKKGVLVFSRKSGFDHFVIFDVLQWRGGGRGEAVSKNRVESLQREKLFLGDRGSHSNVLLVQSSISFEANS